jgi:hypothetical protein
MFNMFSSWEVMLACSFAVPRHVSCLWLFFLVLCCFVGVSVSPLLCTSGTCSNNVTFHSWLAGICGNIFRWGAVDS